MSFAGFKTTGPSCCCGCNIIYLGLDNGTVGWRALHNTGTFPSNEVEIDDPPTLLSNTQARRITIDHRNELGFGVRLSGGNLLIDKYQLDDLMDFTARTTIHTIPNTTPSDTRGLCCDWVNGRVYYSRCTVAGVAGAVPWEYEIRRVDYDGSNDTLLNTESLNPGPVLGGPPQLYGFAWEPSNNYLFYATQLNVDIGGAVGTNSYAYIQRLDADDGSGYTTIKSYEDAVNALGDSSIRGLCVNASEAKLAWISFQQLGSVNTTQTIRYADFDGTGEVTLLSEVGISSHSIQHCVVNNKENKLWFHNFASSGSVGRISRIPFTAGLSTSDIETIMHSDQSTFGSYDIVGAANGLMFGCGMETLGAGYAGGTQSSEL